MTGYQTGYSFSHNVTRRPSLSSLRASQRIERIVLVTDRGRVLNQGLRERGPGTIRIDLQQDALILG